MTRVLAKLLRVVVGFGSEEGVCTKKAGNDKGKTNLYILSILIQQSNSIVSCALRLHVHIGIQCPPTCIFALIGRKFAGDNGIASKVNGFAPVLTSDWLEACSQQ